MAYKAKCKVGGYMDGLSSKIVRILIIKLEMFSRVSCAINFVITICFEFVRFRMLQNPMYKEKQGSVLGIDSP